MRVLITNGNIVYYFKVVAFKTEIYDDDDEGVIQTQNKGRKMALINTQSRKSFYLILHWYIFYKNIEYCLTINALNVSK